MGITSEISLEITTPHIAEWINQIANKYEDTDLGLSRNNYSAYSGVNKKNKFIKNDEALRSRNNYSAYSGVNRGTLPFEIKGDLSRNNYSAYSGVNAIFIDAENKEIRSRNNYSAYSGVNILTQI